MEVTPKKDQIDLTLCDFKQALNGLVDDTFATWIQILYNQAFEKGIEEGEIIQILRQQNPKFDPWTETGLRKRRKLRSERAMRREVQNVDPTRV